ncbi:MAG: S8 family serine peptidase, partial [Polyangiaceae bacterium]
LRRIRLPHNATSYLVSTHLALAIGHAVAPESEGTPPADIVLIAMSSGSWGSPPHLDAMLTACARSGRRGKGAVVVCSTGNYVGNVDSKFDQHSTAHGADEMGSHPDVLLVAPCDLDGRWYRSPPGVKHGSKADFLSFRAQGRMGPSVSIAAPGIKVSLQGNLITADNSSLASAVAAGVAAMVLLANPSLTAFEVRQILRRTSLVPAEADAQHGHDTHIHRTFDRAGHNFKLGAGMVNGLGAVLAALDPVSHALLRITPTLRPPSAPEDLPASPEHAIARWLDYWVTVVSSHEDWLSGYRKHRGTLTRLLLWSPRTEEELCWIARHLFAIFTNAPSHSWFQGSAADTEEHGALLRRLRRLTRTVREELVTLAGRLGAPDTDLLRWLDEVEAALGGPVSGLVEAKLGAALLGRGVGRSEKENGLRAKPPFRPVDLLSLVDEAPDTA